MTVLLWGVPGDSPLDEVGRALRDRGVPVVLLDQRRILDTGIDYRVTERVEGTIWVRGTAYPLDAIDAAYIRPYDATRVPAVARAGRESSQWRHALAVDDTLSTWAEVSVALVVNRPSAMAPNNTKPLQLAGIRKHGFRIPETLITTDPAAALAFWERHGQVVYKSISGVRSKVRRLDASHRARLEDVRWCPTQFQRYIAGTDYRVHVVGDQIFATAIESEDDDYRYPGEGGGAIMRAATLPAAMAEACVAMVSAMHLAVAGIDMRRTPDDEWYCFEVNPSPGFTAYEFVTGQPIAAAIADLLCSAAAVG